jgi:hypothetical protein
MVTDNEDWPLLGTASGGTYRSLRAGSLFGSGELWGDLPQVDIRLVRTADLGQIGPLGTDRDMHSVESSPALSV